MVDKLSGYVLEHHQSFLTSIYFKDTSNDTFLFSFIQDRWWSSYLLVPIISIEREFKLNKNDILYKYKGDLIFALKLKLALIIIATIVGVIVALLGIKIKQHSLKV